MAEFFLFFLFSMWSFHQAAGCTPTPTTAPALGTAVQWEPHQPDPRLRPIRLRQFRCWQVTQLPGHQGALCFPKLSVQAGERVQSHRADTQNTVVCRISSWFLGYSLAILHSDTSADNRCRAGGAGLLHELQTVKEMEVFQAFVSFALVAYTPEI